MKQENTPTSLLGSRVGWMFLGILLLTLLLRALIVPHGLPLLLYEDEPIYLDHALRFGLGDWYLEYFKKPSFFLYFYGFFYGLVWLFSPFLSWQAYVDGFWEDPTLVATTGRLISVAFASGTVAMTFLLGRRLFTPVVGLAAAFLLAFNPTHVEISPIVISDIPSLFCITLSAWLALDVAEKGRWRDYLLCAGAIALTISFKYNVFASTFLIVAHWVRWRETAGPASFPWSKALGDARLWAALALIPAMFFLLNPLALLNAPTFIEHLNHERLHMLQKNAEEDGPGWRFMASFGKLFTRILPNLAGWVPYVLGLVGMIWLGIRYRFRSWILLALPVVFILVVSQFRLINAKYLLPVIPFWYLGAAVLAEDGTRWIAGRFRFSGRSQVALFLAVWLGASWMSIQESISHVVVSLRSDTRNMAWTGIQDHVRLNERVFTEPGTVPLNPHLYRSMVTVGDWQGGSFEMLMQDDMQMKDVDITQLRPDYLLMVLKAKKYQDQRGQDFYRMVYEPGYYRYVQKNYEWVQLYAPQALDIKEKELRVIQESQGFVALTRAVKDHEVGDRQHAGPLLLLMHRKQGAE